MGTIKVPEIRKRNLKREGGSNMTTLRICYYAFYEDEEDTLHPGNTAR